MSGDLSHSDVFISVFGSDEHRADVLAYFKEYTREIRSEVARSLTIKRIPTISFKLDNALEQGDKMARLLNETKTPEPHG